MPIDLTKPANNAPNSSAEMRAQFTSAQTQIDTLIAQIAALQTQVADLQAQLNDRPTFNDLNNAIAGTANSLNGVGDLGGMTISDPPTQGEVQTIADKLSETINAGHR